MAAKKPILASLCVILVFALGLGWHAFRSARQAEAALAALGPRLAQLDGNVQQAKERIATQQRDIAGLRAARKTEPPSKATPSPKAVKGADPATLMASDPGLRALYLNSFRANLVRQYRSMYQGLGLTQLQIDKFEDLATAHADDMVTMQATAREQGLKPSDPGFVELLRQSAGQFAATIASEVDPAIPQQMDQIERLQPIIDNGLPEVPNLTSGQRTQLIQIMANATAGYQSGGSADPKTINWDEVNAKAATILSNSQFLAFKEPQIGIRFKETSKGWFAQQQEGGGEKK